MEHAAEMPPTKFGDQFRSNPLFSRWAENSTRAPLPEWWPTQSQVFHDAPLERLPYQQRVKDWTDSDYASDDERRKISASKRVSLGKNASSLISRSICSQSTLINVQNYLDTKIVKRGQMLDTADCDRMQDNFVTKQEKEYPKDSRQGLLLPTDRLKRPQKVQGIQSWRAAGENNHQRVLDIDRSTCYSHIHSSVHLEWKPSAAAIAYGAPHPNQLSSFKVLGPRKFFGTSGCHYSLFESDIDDLIAKKEVEEKSLAQLERHGIVKFDSDLEALPVDEDGWFVVGHDKEAVLARQAISDYSYESSDDEYDDINHSDSSDKLGWECSGFCKGGSVKSVKISIKRRSQISTASINLSQAEIFFEDARKTEYAERAEMEEPTTSTNIVSDIRSSTAKIADSKALSSLIRSGSRKRPSSSIDSSDSDNLPLFQAWNKAREENRRKTDQPGPFPATFNPDDPRPKNDTLMSAFGPLIESDARTKSALPMANQRMAGLLRAYLDAQTHRVDREIGYGLEILPSEKSRARDNTVVNMLRYKLDDSKSADVVLSSPKTDLTPNGEKQDLSLGPSTTDLEHSTLLTPNWTKVVGIATHADNAPFALENEARSTHLIEENKRKVAAASVAVFQVISDHAGDTEMLDSERLQGKDHQHEEIGTSNNCTNSMQNTSLLVHGNSKVYPEPPRHRDGMPLQRSVMNTLGAPKSMGQRPLVEIPTPGTPALARILAAQLEREKEILRNLLTLSLSNDELLRNFNEANRKEFRIAKTWQSLQELKGRL